MLRHILSAMALSLIIGSGIVRAQEEGRPPKRESTMTNRLPKVGSSIPKTEIFDDAGKPFSTTQLKDEYTVLVFGCLT